MVLILLSTLPQLLLPSPNVTSRILVVRDMTLGIKFRLFIYGNGKEIWKVNGGIYKYFLWAELENCGVIQLFYFNNPQSFSLQGNTNTMEVFIFYRHPT